MTSYRDWMFFIPAGLAVFFMLWVLYKFTQQLAGPDKQRRSAEDERGLLYVVRASASEEARTGLAQKPSAKETRASTPEY